MESNRNHVVSAVAVLPSWDETAALEATGGNAELAHELVQALVATLPAELSDLRRCFQANDWPLLTETAHRMRGATSYCGVPALDSCLRELERTAKIQDPDRVALELAQVEQEAERLARAVTT